MDNATIVKGPISFSIKAKDGKKPKIEYRTSVIYKQSYEPGESDEEESEGKKEEEQEVSENGNTKAEKRKIQETPVSDEPNTIEQSKETDMGDLKEQMKSIEAAEREGTLLYLFCLSIYLSIYVCVCVCVCVHGCGCLFYLSIYVHVTMYVCMYVCIVLYACTSPSPSPSPPSLPLSLSPSLPLSLSACVYLHVCLSVCLYLCIFYIGQFVCTSTKNQTVYSSCPVLRLEAESRDKQIQLERRRRASLFISMLKKTSGGTSEVGTPPQSRYPIVCTFKVKENSGLLMSHSDDYPFIMHHGPHTYFQGEQRLSELNFQTLLLLFF